MAEDETKAIFSDQYAKEASTTFPMDPHDLRSLLHDDGALLEGQKYCVQMHIMVEIFEQSVFLCDSKWRRLNSHRSSREGLPQGPY